MSRGELLVHVERHAFRRFAQTPEAKERDEDAKEMKIRRQNRHLQIQIQIQKEIYTGQKRRYIHTRI